RVLVNIVAYAEKTGLCVVVSQCVQHPGGHLRNRTVVKGQVQNLVGRGHPPGKAGKQALYYFWRLCEVHRKKLICYGIINFVLCNVSKSKRLPREKFFYRFFSLTHKLSTN